MPVQENFNGLSGSRKANPISPAAILQNIQRHRLLYIVSTAVCLALAYLFILTSQPQWKIKSRILVDDLKGRQSTKVLGTGLTGAFNDQGASSSADNEIQVLKTNALIANVVSSLDLHIVIRKIHGLEKREIFDEAPFILDIRPEKDSLIQTTYYIETLSNNRLKITNEGKTIVSSPNVSLHFKDSYLMFGRKQNFNAGDKYDVTINTKAQAIDYLSKNLEVKLSDKNATAIDLTLECATPRKGEKILNELMSTYLRQNLENKIKSDQSALDFISDRVNKVERELASIEGRTEQYKRQNSISDLQTQSKTLITSAGNQVERLNQVDVQLSVIEDLQNALNAPDGHPLPASVGIQNEPNLVSSIARYNDLLQARQRLTLSYQDNNPIAKNADAQVESARSALLQSLSIYQKGLQISREQLARQVNSVNSNIRDIPGKERVSLDFSREQSLKEQLYVYLLQKKEETAIAKIATTAGARIIDPALSELKPFKPQKSMVYLLALVAGAGIALGLGSIMDSLNEKVISKAEIEGVTHTKLLGEIVQSNENAELVVRKDSRTLIAEEFRALRTNLQFILPNERSKVILITSSRTGEGKTFMTLNVGMSLALAAKKVVLLELDLRKPKLRETLGLPQDPGFSAYINQNGRPADAVKPSGMHENCSVVTAGGIASNPSELLAHPKMDELIAYLRENFEYIIMDTAPAGVVSDALALGKHADICMFLIRQNFTEKRHLAMLEDLIVTQKLKNVHVVLNGMSIKEKRKTIKNDANGYYTQV